MSATHGYLVMKLKWQGKLTFLYSTSTAPKSVTIFQSICKMVVWWCYVFCQWSSLGEQNRKIIRNILNLIGVLGLSLSKFEQSKLEIMVALSNLERCHVLSKWSRADFSLDKMSLSFYLFPVLFLSLLLPPSLTSRPLSLALYRD